MYSKSDKLLKILITKLTQCQYIDFSSIFLSSLISSSVKLKFKFKSTQTVIVILVCPYSNFKEWSWLYIICSVFLTHNRSKDLNSQHLIIFNKKSCIGLTAPNYPLILFKIIASAALRTSARGKKNEIQLNLQIHQEFFVYVP